MLSRRLPLPNVPTNEDRVRQRADLTFKANRGAGRHGWLRLTPAYSVRLVGEVLDEFAEPGQRVLDPFSGTGTTALSAAQRGLDGTGLDINPFLIWLGRAKTRRFAPRTLERAREEATAIARAGLRPRDELEPPPMHNIERWWDRRALSFLCATRAAMGEHGRGATRDLHRLALCRAAIRLSNAAFNHQSMSFREGPAHADGDPEAWAEELEQDVATLCDQALPPPPGRATLVQGDARRLAELEPDVGFDLLVTSPPYPNRMSYIRELRPYMYWLDYLRRARAAGELDWQAIGGTWGVATSRLASWKPDGPSRAPRSLHPILDAIEGSHPRNGPLMARYVHRYFHDMGHHVRAAHARLRPGASAHYIVGNASFYGHLVPAEQLLARQLQTAGFRGVEIRTVRKRNSKRELFEFHVWARRYQ